MKLEQAIYGEVRGGHALRLASDASSSWSELASRMDLPDTAPPGASWSPFLSGFPHGNRYVVARTFSDPAATRAGMVLSHALIVPLDEIATTMDLRPLLSLLISTPIVPESLRSREISASSLQPPPAGDLLATAEALTTRGKGPVVRIGHQDFEQLVASLWFHLWPELRASFAFRLSLGPQDLVELHPPSLVCTPSTLAARWTGYRVVPAAAPLSVSRATEILSGGAGAEPVLAFARGIDARLDNFGNLSLLERAYELGSTSNPPFDECVAVLRLVEILSPDPAAGAAIKARLTERLVSRLPSATASDVLLLRNLRVDAFPTAAAVWSGLRTWAASNGFSMAEDGPLLSAIENATSPAAAVPAWREGLLSGLADASRSQSSMFPGAFWRWADAQAATLITFASHLPVDRDLEGRLADAVPATLGRTAGDAAMAVAVSKRWFRLHGTAAGATLGAREAIRRQLAVDVDIGTLAGVRAALHRATPSEMLDIALELADTRLLQVAADEVARAPQLLRDTDFRGAAAQSIWGRALGANPNAWQGPANQGRAFGAVLDTLLDSGAANNDLLVALSATPMADISDYPRRAQVWGRTSGKVHDNLLKATASGWIRRAISTGVADPPETELAIVVLAGDVLDQALRGTDVGPAIRVMSMLPAFDEVRFLHWLANRTAVRSALSASDTEAIGKLVLQRGWQKAVDHILNRARKERVDLRPVLGICRSMVSTLARWALGVSPVSLDEKWAIWEDVACELYPTGPDSDGLWDRAGGRQAELPTHGTGRARWHDAIGQIRRGKRPPAAALIGEMARDYPLNEELRRLALDPDFKDTRR